MALSRFLHRQGAVQKINVEAKGALDGQGKPSYGTAVEIKARITRMVDVAYTADGDEVKTTVSIWIAGDQPVLPVENDRLDLDQAGEKVIVVERTEHRELRNQSVIDHIMLKAREE